MIFQIYAAPFPITDAACPRKCGPAAAAAAAPENLLERRISGPTLDPLNRSLHFNKILGGFVWGILFEAGEALS